MGWFLLGLGLVMEDESSELSCFIDYLKYVTQTSIQKRKSKEIR